MYQICRNIDDINIKAIETTDYFLIVKCMSGIIYENNKHDNEIKKEKRVDVDESGSGLFLLLLPDMSSV